MPKGMLGRQHISPCNNVQCALWPIPCYDAIPSCRPRTCRHAASKNQMRRRESPWQRHLCPSWPSHTRVLLYKSVQQLSVHGQTPSVAHPRPRPLKARPTGRSDAAILLVDVRLYVVQRQGLVSPHGRKRRCPCPALCVQGTTSPSLLAGRRVLAGSRGFPSGCLCMIARLAGVVLNRSALAARRGRRRPAHQAPSGGMRSRW